MSDTNGAVAPPIESPEDPKANPTWLSRMEIGLRAELDQLDRKAEALNDQLRAVNRDRTRYRRVLKAMDPEVPLPGRQQGSTTGRSKRSQTGKGLAAGTVRRFTTLITELDQEEFTAIDLYYADGGKDHATDSGMPHYYNVLNKLRDVEYVCPAGRDPVNRRQLWRLMPDADEVLERVING